MSTTPTPAKAAAIKTIVAANEAAAALQDNAKLSNTNAFTGANSFAGTVAMSAIPTSDPTVAGQLWANAGVLTISAG